MLIKLPTPHLRPLLAAGAAAAAVAALAACGSSSSAGTTPSGTAKSTQTVRIALDYTANVNYLGIYAAKANGYFAQNGITPQIIPYAETPAETLIQSGRTDLGISYPPEVVINRAKGLKYKAVAAIVAGNTTALAVLASSPITRPSQLERQALRRIRDRQRQADHQLADRGRRRTQPRLAGSRSEHRRDSGAREPPDRLHGRVRRHRRRHRGTAGHKAAPVSLQPVSRRSRQFSRTPCSSPAIRRSPPGRRRCEAR